MICFMVIYPLPMLVVPWIPEDRKGSAKSRNWSELRPGRGF